LVDYYFLWYVPQYLDIGVTFNYLILLRSGSLFVHKWLWFKTFLEHADNPSTKTVIIHFLCVWSIPFLLVVLWQPALEPDGGDAPKFLLDPASARPVKAATPCSSPVAKIHRTRGTTDSDLSAVTDSMV
jgi:hypothetical protein